jgi:hypothetical protein
MNSNKISKSLAIIPAWVAGFGTAISLSAYVGDMGGHVPLGAVCGILFTLATMLLAPIGLFASFKAGRKDWGLVNFVLLCGSALLWLAVFSDL